MANVNPLHTKHWLTLLATLFVIVLIAHLAIITSASSQFNINKSTQITAFTTRMIELPTPTPVVEKTPEVVTPPRLVNPKPKPVAPKAAPILLPTPAETATAPIAPVTPVTPAVEPVTTAAPSPTSPGAAPSVPETALSTAAPTLEPAQPTSAASSSEAGLPPPAFTAQNSGRHTYKVIFTKNGNSNQGKADVQWQQDGEKYALSMSASMLFIEVFAWKSIGLLSPTGLLPERFSDKRYRKSEVAAHFDRAQGKITFSANTPEAPLLAGAQDRISVIWQIAGMLSADPKRYPPGNTFSLQTVSSTNAEPWLFTVNEPETLNLEKGSQIAWRLTRNPRREFDQKIELWFVPAMNYLPARFRFTETNGDYVDVVWQSVENLSNTLSR
jgi:Protein of unknown function (DUF3108)